jgi:enoyl-CoA hydratase/carnithine racemase
MDLVSAHEARDQGTRDIGGSILPPSGFGGISNCRTSRKPVIAAVNGFALGGGMEMVVSCNIVVATEKSQFGLPEVKQGVVIAAGGLARLARSVSYQIASELVLTGRFMKADEAKAYGLLNEIIANDANVVDAAIVWAKQITSKYVYF